jgi:hypothetical protein
MKDISIIELPVNSCKYRMDIAHFGEGESPPLRGESLVIHTTKKPTSHMHDQSRVLGASGSRDQFFCGFKYRHGLDHVGPNE